MVFVNEFEKVMNELKELENFFFDQCSLACLCWSVLEARSSWFSLRSHFQFVSSSDSCKQRAPPDFSNFLTSKTVFGAMSRDI